MSKLTEQERAELAAFLKERDEVLRSLDVNRVEAFYRKMNRRGGGPTTKEAWRIMMHQCRLQIRSFTEHEKAVSRKWLLDRGYKVDMECGPDGLPVRKDH